MHIIKEHKTCHNYIFLKPPWVKHMQKKNQHVYFMRLILCVMLVRHIWHVLNVSISRCYHFIIKEETPQKVNIKTREFAYKYVSENRHMADHTLQPGKYVQCFILKVIVCTICMYFFVSVKFLFVFLICLYVEFLFVFFICLYVKFHVCFVWMYLLNVLFVFVYPVLLVAFVHLRQKQWTNEGSLHLYVDVIWWRDTRNVTPGTRYTQGCQRFYYHWKGTD